MSAMLWWGLGRIAPHIVGNRSSTQTLAICSMDCKFSFRDSGGFPKQVVQNFTLKLDLHVAVGICQMYVLTDYSKTY